MEIELMADTPESPIQVSFETVSAVSDDPKRLWRSAIFDRFRNRCGNCGSEDHLRVKMVVPEEAGGQYVESNGVCLCRTCEIATDTTRPSSEDTRRPINFWVSKTLHQDLQERAKDTSFKSMASLIRYLMTKFVEEPDRFDDLAKYQDIPESDLKINVWVEKGMYATFKDLVDSRGLTVTDALKSLIKLYQVEGPALKVKV